MIAIELTPLFANNDAITQTCKCYATPQDFMVRWCRLAKLLLQSGKFTARSGKILNANRRLMVSEKEYEGLKHFLDNGMIIPTDVSAVSELKNEDFEVFWSLYPTRTSESGHMVKIGKDRARQKFSLLLSTRAEYAELLLATANYAKVTNAKFVKDPERFFKCWRDYLEISEAAKSSVRTVLDQKGYEALYGK